MITGRRLGTVGLLASLLLAACGYGVTGQVNGVGAASATLTGVADGIQPGDISYWFEYGTTDSYGLSTPPVTASVTGPIPVQSVVAGLATNTTFHYRLCVHQAGRGVCGSDLTFATGTAALTVNHAGDAPDSHPGNGICQDQGAVLGRCSMRAAVQEANARNGNDTVIVQPGVGTIVLTAGELLVTGGLNVQGNDVTVDAGGASRVLNLGSGQLTLQRARLTGGRAPTGGGLLVGAGATVTVVESTISGNESTGLSSCTKYFSGVSPGFLLGCEGSGGGAGIWSAGVLHLSRSTVSGNHGIGGGCVSTPGPGGGYVETCSWSQGAGVSSSGGTVVDSTISGNWADFGSGSGLSAAAGAVAVSQSTIVGNLGNRPTQLAGCCFGGGDGPPVNGTITVQGSIVAGAASVCGFEGVSSLGHNVVSGTNCGFAQPTDQENVDPQLGLLADNGGPTPTHLPFANSPAVDAIPVGTPGLCNGTAPYDQRGVARPVGPACDIGAVEGDSGTTPTPLELVVDHGGDDTDAVPGDGVCQDAAGPAGACSLRAAVAESNARPGPDNIVISPGVDVALTRAAAAGSTDVGDLDVGDDLAIDGDGAVIDAAGINTTGVNAVFDVSAADLTLSRVTLTGGRSSALRYVADGHALRLTEVTVRGNSAIQGGGIYIGGGSATVERSTVSGNTSSTAGGGVYVRGAALTITDSTVSGNATTASDSEGGGLYVIGGSIGVTRSSIVGNTTPYWAAIYAGGVDSAVTLTGSVLANPGGDCGGDVTSGGHNRAEDTTCFLSGPGDQQGVALLLGPLADNGGATWTHLPSAGSPLLNAIPTGTAGLCDTATATDQRGIHRPQGSGCDAGAVEVAVTP